MNQANPETAQNDFLASVVRYYLSRYENADWSDLCFVFPSHRAGLFFKQALRSQLAGRTVFGMKIQTINELIASQSSLIVADNLTLCFELYEVYRNVFADVEGARLDFDSFYSWAHMFIADFDDVDKYMVDARRLYSNTLDYENLADDYSHLTEEQRKVVESFWDVTFEQREGTQEFFKRRFVETYKHMYELYETYRNRLRIKGIAYPGMIYRDLAESVGNSKLSDTTVRYAFIGFNALTRSEQLIFRWLNKVHRADFFWDYTPQMLKPIIEGDDHGAGRFIRQHIAEFPSPDGYELPQPESIPQITITNFAYPQGQTSKVAQFLNEVYDDNSSERTAVVLTDENMLLPVISALPEKVERVNVTMGYPLPLSQLYGFADLLARLHSLGCVADGSTCSFYAKYALPVLQHACVAELSAEAGRDKVQAIVDKNMIRIDASFFADDELLAMIFQPVDSSSVTRYLRDIFRRIYDSTPDDNQLQRECAHAMLKTVNLFDGLLTGSGVAIESTDLVFSMFLGLAQGRSVDFCGMPLAGLQVLGILETRAVDFDNIAILDMNEGVFPKSGAAQTFIPYVLRRAFELPTHEFQDSIFAYYFFRLINRAKRVELMYSSYIGANRGGMSRFLLQLIYEYRWPVAQQVAVHRLNIALPKAMRIEKTPDVMARMHAKFCEKKFLSPTAMTSYIECPVRFYLSHVIDIRDADDIVEEAGNQHIGNIFHGVMQQMFREGVVMTDDLRKQLLNDENITALLCRSFADVLHIDGCTEADLLGRNILYFSMLKDYIRQIIRVEKVGAHYLAAEKTVRANTLLPDGKKVILGGIIDRQHIDTDGRRCVVDYKTGYCKGLEFKKLDDLFDPQKHDKFKEIFQTLVYCRLLELSGVAEPLYPCIVWVRQLFSDDFSINVCLKEDKQSVPLEYSAVKEPFAERLDNLVAEIFDPEKPFESCNDSEKCDKCPFKNFCF